MSQRASKKAESRAAIVASAATLVREAGVRGMSVPAAMRGAGLTQGAFYAHFQSKDELLADAFDLAMADAVDLVSGAAGETRGPEAIVAIADRYLSAEHRDSPGMGCPLPALLGEFATAPSDQSRQMLATGVETMCRRVEEAGAGAVTGEDVQALVVLLVGGQVAARALRGTPRSDEMLAACRAAVARSLTESGRAEPRTAREPQPQAGASGDAVGAHTSEGGAR